MSWPRSMKTLTPRQKAVWRHKMTEIEKAIINWHNNPLRHILKDREEPDGSFAMRAFRAGWTARARTEK